MNLITCSGCGQRRLFFPSQIVAISNDADGITARYECFCGTENAVHTGRREGRHVAAAA